MSVLRSTSLSADIRLFSVMSYNWKHRQAKHGWGNGGRSWLCGFFIHVAAAFLPFFFFPSFFLHFVMQGGSVGTNSGALCLVPKVCLSSDPKQHSGRCVSAANPQENERAVRNGRLAPETTDVLPVLHPAHRQPAHSASTAPVQLCWQGQKGLAPVPSSCHSAETPRV